MSFFIIISAVNKIRWWWGRMHGIPQTNPLWPQHRLGPVPQDLSGRNKKRWGRRNRVWSLPHSVMQILLSCFTDKKITWDNIWAKKNSFEKTYKQLINIWNLLKFTGNEINTLIIKWNLKSQLHTIFDQSNLQRLKKAKLLLVIVA